MAKKVLIELEVTFDDLPDDVRAECAKDMDVSVEEIERLDSYSATGLADVFDRVTNPEMFTEFFAGSDTFAQITETEVKSARFVE